VGDYHETTSDKALHSYEITTYKDIYLIKYAAYL